MLFASKWQFTAIQGNSRHFRGRFYDTTRSTAGEKQSTVESTENEESAIIAQVHMNLEIL
jgi:hypothetical protein